MHFSSAFLAVVLPLLAAAQNPFNVPIGGYGTLNAGQTVTLSWAPSTQGSVNILLRNGPQGNLSPGQTVASNIPNTGSTTVTIPSNVADANNYAFQIVDSSNSNISNYTPVFSVAGGSGSASSAAASSGASSAASSAASSRVSSGVSSSPVSSTPGVTSGPSSITGVPSSTGAGSSTGANSSTGAGSTGVTTRPSSAAPQSTFRPSTAGAAIQTAAPYLAGIAAFGAFIL